MSKYGMLGLLGGMGSGMQKAGDTLMKQSLIEAEQQRQLNLEKIRREWNREDLVEQRAYDEGRDEFVWKRKTEYDQGLYERNRKDQLEDAEAKRQHDIRLRGMREPSEYDKKVAAAAKDLEAGLISRDQYNQVVLGLSKDVMGVKDAAGIRSKSRDQAYNEIMGKDPELPPTQEQLAAIDQRADELYSYNTGQVPRQGEQPKAQRIHPGEIADIAKTLVNAGYDPAKDKAEQTKRMEDSGMPSTVIAEVISQADQLHAKKQERVQREREKKDKRAKPGPPPRQAELSREPGPLVRAIRDARPATAKERRERMRESFAREAPAMRPKGLME